MKRNLETPLLNVANEPFEPPVVLGFVCSNAATGMLPGDDGLAIATKIALYSLAKKLVAGGVVDLSAEEIAMLKERIGRMFSIQIIGRAFEHLEADLAETPAQ